MTYDLYIKALEPVVRRVRTDVTAVKGEDGMAWTREPLTKERLTKHLNGGPARGVCPIKAGESTTMLAVLDFDSHKGESTWTEMQAAAVRVSDELMALGFKPIPWRSRGGKGIHLYLVWDEPQDAYTVREVLREVLEAAGFGEGQGGIKAGRVEVFPRQSEVPVGKFGNQVILPLAGASEPLDALDMEPMGREAALWIGWPTSPPLTKRERPARQARSYVVSDVDLATKALRAITNDGQRQEESDRDWWFRVVCAAKEAGVDEDEVLAWTQNHPGHADDEQFRTVWRSITAGEPDGTPASYLFSVAEGYGFNEHIVQEFDVVVPPAGELEPPRFERDKAGKILSTATNAQIALSRPDVIGVRLGYDEFMGRRVIVDPGSTEWRPFKDSDYFELRVRLERIGFVRPGQELVREAVRCVAEANTFDSAIIWGRSLRWDGAPRVERFFQRYAGVSDTAYHRAVSVYLWTALAGRCLDPGCKVDMVPVLIGDQGSGKTTLVETLAPTEEAFIEINLAMRNEDQVARSLRGKLVGEIAELRGLRGRDAEDIKAWISRRHEDIRALYAEFHSKYPRRLVMVGTGNNPEFLSDDTGERRWLPLTVGATDIAALRSDRDQLWAEAIVLWQAGGVQWREAQKLAVNEHAAFKVRDSWEEPIEEWLNEADIDGVKNSSKPFTVHTVLVNALRFAHSSIKRSDEMRVGAVLRALGYEKFEKRDAGEKRKVWRKAKEVIA